jgi:thiol-disulfide isomerase/thioredoxin
MLFLSLLLGCIDTGLELSESPDPGLEPIAEPDPIYWEACSYKEGDHICDFTYANAADTTTTLYDYYGSIVVIEYFTEWCPYCRQAAERAGDYIGEDEVLLSVMLENQYGMDPRLEDAERWASAYNLDPESVLRAGDYILDGNAEWGPDVTGLPGFIIVDEDMVIKHKIRGWSLELMQQIISDMKQEE